MSVKISIAQAASKYRVTQRTIFRWVIDHDITQYADGTYDSEQLDDAVNDLVPKIYGYLDVDWNKALCKGLPTDFFYKIEDRGVSKIIDIDIFRFTCAPCPIWKQCLNYATGNESYGVWGGMTADERRSLKDFRKSDIRDKVIKDFAEYGITQEMIYEAIGEK